MSAAPVPDTSTHSLNGLIVESIPRRLRPIINAWVLGASAATTAKRVRNYVRNRTEYVVKINGTDPLYDDVQAWILDSMPTRQRRSIRVKSSGHSGYAVPDDGRRRDVSPALHLGYDGTMPQQVTIDGHRIEVRVDAKEWSYAGGRADEYTSFMNAYTMLTLVAHSTAGQAAVLARLDELAEARRVAKRSPRLWIGSRWGSFTPRDDLAIRPLESVIVKAGVKEALVDDLRGFLDAEQDYADVGLPWHHGYLLHGPPGTGKTSLAQAVAGALNLDVYVIMLADVEDDSTFVRMLGEIQPRSILVLEDIDVVHATRERDDPPGKFTMQGLLNGLDGLVTPHGLIVCMTTNHREVLDEAVVRAGRVDREFEVGPLVGDDLRRLAEHLAGGQLLGGLFDRPRIPADVVSIVKPHLRDRAAMRAAIESEFNCRPWPQVAFTGPGPGFGTWLDGGVIDIGINER